ncbi:hypothetical protein SPRG_05388 [Saprolegnia parasitica CBS 223.65]|uniref:Uncharacterized protein n=1 Tax=Saprolegnia parasitica (strain CBS 223.65) TaxID=695850 RepID=A0A067CIZ0_SAPPC|nr:hypothetical protein SPRG_05388 [Saprolegnia parasitica CBS 223.65]KDO29145.1 hypothetical protein SPRG_05388 [Saprolegnia parasitica CBS 223.65]|eukprot:XP_012200025.1 hypothetical protein SPRG_05388 [Saprolegnia parasitica CBS 223.65]
MADDDVDASLRQAEFDLLYQRMMRRRAPSPVESPTAATPATTPHERRRRRRDPNIVRNTRAYARAERNSIVLSDSDDDDDEPTSSDDVVPSTPLDIDAADDAATDANASPSLLLPRAANTVESHNAPRRKRLSHPPRYSVAAAQSYARLDAVAALLRPPDFAPTVVVFGSFGPLTTCAVPMAPRPLASPCL